MAKSTSSPDVREKMQNISSVETQEFRHKEDHHKMRKQCVRIWGWFSPIWLAVPLILIVFSGLKSFFGHPFELHPAVMVLVFSVSVTGLVTMFYIITRMFSPRNRDSGL